MANLDFLDARHRVFTQNDDAWAREERRLYGGDPVLEELVQWRNESTAKYEARQAEASWIGFPKTHASILAGHIVAQLPVPNYGTLGDVRAREERGTQSPTVAELFHYNADGVGADGTQFPAWVAGVLQRALATGHRWCLVEMPRRGVIDEVTNARVTQADVLNGHRPYLVEYSPRDVPYWEYTDGRLDWAVLRTPVGAAGLVDGRWEPAPVQLGYYLLVRAGYQGLGPEFSSGGWWLYDSDKRLTTQGDWSRTRGQIPLVRLTAESSQGTKDWPAISRSLTMELGQMAVSLMNRISERNFDASDAAKSVKYILGASKEGFNLTVEFHEDNAILIPVVGEVVADGKYTVPTIYDGSSGAVAADVFTTIITGIIAEAHEVMVRQLTSSEDSSGRSKEVGFGEATSPLLASLAANTETFLNTLIYFTELRAGSGSPSGFVTLPREFKIAPVLEKIDAAIERMKGIGAMSPTLVADLIKQAATDQGIWPKGKPEGTKAEAELRDSLVLVQRQAQATVFDTFAKSGSVAGAAPLAGLTVAETRKLQDVEEPVVVEGNGQNGAGAVPPRIPVLTQ